MISCPRVWQAFGDIDHCYGKFKQAFFKIIGSPCIACFVFGRLRAALLVRGLRFEVQGSKFPSFTLSPPAIAASAFGPRPDDPGHEPRPCPRLVRWFADWCRNTDWQAGWWRRPESAVQSFSRARDSMAFRAA